MMLAAFGMFQFSSGLITSELVTRKASEASQGLKIVKLQRSSVILPHSAERAGKQKNFYSATLTVGKPAQEFRFVFDLGGGTTFVPSQECVDPACLERRRYNKWASDTAEDIQANGHLVEARVHKTLLRRRDRGTLGLHSIDVGSGKVKGTFVREEVCVHSESDGLEDNDPRCFPLAIIAATMMSDMPFMMEPYDGSVGLALKGMSLSMEFNFLSSFRQGYGSAIPTNSFGLHIGTDADGGEITFGGYDVKRLTHPLKWARVADPQDGRWQVAISAIRIGNHTLDACRNNGCIAALDYSSSLLSAPSSLVGGLEETLKKLALPSGFGDGCQHVAIPDLHFELSDDLTLTLPAEDFVNDFGASKKTLASPMPSCQPQLVHEHDDGSVPLGSNVFILGEATLRRYYTFFDADSLQVGFSLAATQPKAKELSSGTSGSDGNDKKKKRETIVVLFQVNLKRSKTAPSIGL
jgi:saccharopepsin